MISSGDKVTVLGFDSFEPRDWQARDDRNPQIGKKLKIPAIWSLAFGASKGFEAKVSGLYASTYAEVIAVFQLTKLAVTLGGLPVFHNDKP